MSSADGDDRGATSGRLAVSVIFGGIIVVIVVAGYAATQLRAGTRERLSHPRPASSAAP